jgi:hypothetical protein
MAEFERVPLRPRPGRNWLPSVALGLAIFLALAIVKPWDSSRTETAGDGSAPPTFFIRPTERTGPRAYDPQLFGNREPDPAWELWPAGYVVQFGLAGPVKVPGQDDESPSPHSSAPPASPQVPRGSTEPRGSAAPTAAPESGLPLEPGIVDLGTADHLVALGINTPLDARIESVRLFRLTDIRSDLVPIVRLPTLWESSHFLVIAPADPVNVGQPGIWEPGAYRLELTTAFGDIRVVDLRIRPPLADGN